MKNHANHMAKGTALGFIGAAVCLPTGLLTAAFLSRKLGPENYGVLTLTATLIVWLEVIITVGFNRAAVKFISETKNWEPVATRFLQVQTILGIFSAAFLALLAPVFAVLLDAPEMTGYIRIYALCIPITAVSSIHTSVLIGLGQYGRRAVLNALYWVFRLILIFWFVSVQSKVSAVILANIVSSVIVVIWSRFYVKPSFFLRSDFPLQKIWDYGWPLFLFTVCMNFFGQIDLFFVKALCSSPEMAGYYSSAKNITIVPALFTASLAPLLVAKLAFLSIENGHQAARDITAQSIRFLICLIPFAALVSGSSEEIIMLVYGKAFLPASRFLAVIVFAALGLSLFSVSSAMIVAAGYPKRTLLSIGPALAILLICMPILTSRYGALGAAALTTASTWLGAGANTLMAARIWGIGVSCRTIVVSLLVSIPVYFLSSAWATPGFFVVVKLIVLGFLAVLLYWASGEIGVKPIRLIKKQA